MTKQEKIIEAYGEYWKDYGHLTNDNGFIPQSKLFYPVTEMFKNGIDIQVVCSSPKGDVKWRPRLLQGIEYNNGWIKIESFDDLLDEVGTYEVHYKIDYGVGYRTEIFTGRLSNSIHHVTGKPLFSNYKKYIKSENPIY